MWITQKLTLTIGVVVLSMGLTGILQIQQIYAQQDNEDQQTYQEVPDGKYVNPKTGKMLLYSSQRRYNVWMWEQQTWS